jgi:hypothetical protein
MLHINNNHSSYLLNHPAICCNAKMPIILISEWNDFIFCGGLILDLKAGYPKMNNWKGDGVSWGSF